MRLLLDTHIFLWWVREDKRLPKISIEKIKEAEEVYLSSASVWEIAIKMRLGKISGNIDVLIQEIGIKEKYGKENVNLKLSLKDVEYDLS